MLEEGYLLVRPDLAEQKLEAEKAKAAGGTSVGTVTPTPTPGIGQPTPGSTTTTVVPGTGTPPGGGTTVTHPGGTETTTSKGGKPGRVTLDVEVPFTDFHTFYTGIINALGRNADDIKIRVEIEASSDSGFSQTLIEDTVKETLFNLFRSDAALRVDEE